MVVGSSMVQQRCEHDFVEEEKATELKETSADLLAEGPTKSEHGNIVWKAKLSLFTESLYEMLQYQMGSRILTFLQSETLNTAQPDDDKTKVKEEDKSVDHVVEVMEDETDDEDPEEDPEENKEMEESELKSDGNEKTDSKADTGEKETSAVMEVAVDKDLLQAFRVCDGARVGESLGMEDQLRFGMKLEDGESIELGDQLGQLHK
ncbi:hypothetical protein SO802_011400 [Lithocarpus litseifolius]|uniref:Uncharacterized protein n=1 Tax=Lithocarpus litseifolius TaxID=425828 RepID=A0AAW2D0K0_9ROSI